jgi:hypothetical protein
MRRVGEDIIVIVEENRTHVDREPEEGAVVALTVKTDIDFRNLLNDVCWYTSNRVRNGVFKIIVEIDCCSFETNANEWFKNGESF